MLKEGYNVALKEWLKKKHFLNVVDVILFWISLLSMFPLQKEIKSSYRTLLCTCIGLAVDLINVIDFAWSNRAKCYTSLSDDLAADILNDGESRSFHPYFTPFCDAVAERACSKRVRCI